MSNRYQTAAYIFAFLALGGLLLGWKLFVAAERPADVAVYQQRLSITGTNISAPAEISDDSLKIYAVNVVHRRPFKEPFIGYGIYLGQGLVLTAAHVVGRWPFVTSPHVLIAGQDLAAKVIKTGSLETIDLALLSVDQARLPVSLRLRRNPICKGVLQVGMNVIVVYPERTIRSQIISPLLIAPQYRMKFSTLINEPQGSGSGLFNAEKKCLLGISSRQVEKHALRNGRVAATANGFAGYFVPLGMVTNFMPPEFRP